MRIVRFWSQKLPGLNGLNDLILDWLNRHWISSYIVFARNSLRVYWQSESEVIKNILGKQKQKCVGVIWQTYIKLEIICFYFFPVYVSQISLWKLCISNILFFKRLVYASYLKGRVIGKDTHTHIQRVSFIC